jgi:hypothetical protein
MRRQEADEVQLRIEQGLDLQEADPRMAEQASDAVDRLLVELDRREHEVRRGERRDQADVGIRMGVHHADVEPAVHRLGESPEVPRERRVLIRLALEKEHLVARRHEHERRVRQLRPATRHQPIGSEIGHCARCESARGAVKLPWWSKSIASTRLPRCTR